MILLSLILPVHNEEGVIESVFEKTYKNLKKSKITFEIILVENGSRDNSLKIIKDISYKYLNTKALSTKQGYTRAIKAGAKISKGKYICYMPSDGQSDEKKIPQLIKLINNNQCNIAKVKRASRENLVRYLISKIFSITMSLVFSTKLIDVNGSPRVLLKKDFDLLDIQSNDSFGDAEMLIKSAHLNWKINEIPMKNIDRLGGKSTRSVNTFLEFFKNIYTYKTSNLLTKWENNIT